MSHKNDWVDKLYALDRRVIFIFVFLGVLIPFLIKFHLPVKPTIQSKTVYATIEKIAAKPNGGTILVSMDFDPASKAELGPMSLAIFRHIMSHKGKIKVVVMNHWQNGVGLTEEIIKKAAEETGAKYGDDYVFLGWKAGMANLIVNMGQDFYGAFSKDAKGNDLKTMAATKNITVLKDFDYMIDFSAGSAGVDMWVQYGQSKFKFLMAACCVAVMGPDFYPYLQAGQINALMAGLSAAAEYEVLINKPETAVEGMKPQSIGHIILILFIILGNIMFFVKKRRNRA